MKKLILLLVLVSNLTLYSQNLPKGLAPNERDPGFLKSIGIYKNPYQEKNTNTTIYTSPPNFNVRTMAEWEEIEAITITWSTDYGITEEIILSQIVEEAINECDVIIICNNQNIVSTYLSSQGINSSNIYYIETDFNNIWIRDYGQNTIYKNNVEERFLVDWIYNRNRPYDDLVPEYIASYFNLNMYNTTESPYDLMATGGNFMSDGMGTAFSSKLIEEENNGGYAWNGPSGNVFYPNHTLSEIENIMEEFMGINTYIIMDNLPYDGIHHIDMHMKLLNEETILIAEYPPGVADGPQIEANIQYVLSNYNSAFGSDFKIIRIPSPPSSGGYYPDNGGYYRTYTNSVFINKTVLVPFYREEFDTIARRIYEKALPGYNIVGIDVDNQGSNLISYSGAIHCITHSVGVNEPLLIQHQQLNDTTPLTNYNVSATIQHTSGIANANLYFTTDLNNGYNIPIPMNNTSSNEWEADIPGTITAGNTVFYYIEAFANNGKTLNRPITAPNGYFEFKILNNLSNTHDIKQNINLNIFPNPANSITCIELNLDNFTKGNILMKNVLGETVKIIHKGNISKRNSKFFIDASKYSSGLYYIIFENENDQKIKKLLIK